MTAMIDAPAPARQGTVTMTIIATETCARCKMIASSLTRKGRAFTYALPDTHPDDHADAQGLGYNQAPVTLIRDENGEVIDHWPLFQPGKITEWVSKLASA